MAILMVAASISHPGQFKCEIKIRISTRKHNRLSKKAGKENNATTNKNLGDDPSEEKHINNTISHNSNVKKSERGCTTSSLVTEYLTIDGSRVLCPDKSILKSVYPILAGVQTVSFPLKLVLHHPNTPNVELKNLESVRFCVTGTEITGNTWKTRDIVISITTVMATARLDIISSCRACYLVCINRRTL